MTELTLSDVYRARRRLEGRVARTPLVESPALAEVAGVPVFLKLETVQPTGSFKIRGATNAVAVLATRGVTRVVTASTGNHGRAVAYAARREGIQAVVCLSALVPANKVDAIRALGAEVRIVGAGQDEAELEALRLVSDEGVPYVPPFDDLDIIAGQATVGLEIVEALPEVAQVIVPLSGGGLFSGVAFAVKQSSPMTRAIGVTMREGAAMHVSLAAGRPVLVDEVPSLADSLGGGIGLKNRYTFAMTRDLIDDALLVDEGAIARAIVHAYRCERLVVEGAAAAAISVVLEGAIHTPATRRGPIVIIISGSNIDMKQHASLMLKSDADAPLHHVVRGCAQ